MDPVTLIQICKAYSNLGRAVQEQMDVVLDGMCETERGEHLNGNALAMISRWARETTDALLREYRSGGSLEDLIVAMTGLAEECEGGDDDEPDVLNGSEEDGPYGRVE